IAGVAAFGIIRGGKQRSAHDYFLGRDEIPWWVVCFSIVAAETSTLTFISIPGLSYLTNLGFLQLAIGYLIGRVTVSALFLPSYYQGELSTAYAFLESRFGISTRRFASLVFLFTRLAADGVRLFATAIPLQLVLDIEYPVAIAILAAAAFLYTFAGGVRGVIWVDAVQMFMYLGGAILAGIAIVAATEGGIAEALRPAAEAGKFRLFDMGWEGDFLQRPYTVLSGILGGAFLSMASHGTDQLIVQRVLATKSLRAGQKALIGSGVIIIAQFALFLVVGLLLYGHYNGASLASLGVDRADKIFPLFIIEGLPPGVSGLIIAGLMAAALSTLAGSMSSMASSVTLDLVKPFVKSLSGERELRISRGATILAAVLLVGAALFFMNTSQTVVELALSIASFTYGGLLGTFLLGVLSGKTKEREALIAFAAGIAAMVGVITLKLVAWTWFTLVGVLVTLLVGSVLTALRNARSRFSQSGGQTS
ncbi:MAG: sodium:solute symporter, partial [Bacteroidota bacterium]